MAKRSFKSISYYQVPVFFGPTWWRCHVYTSDGGHYEGEGYTKQEAKENAMDVLRAND